MSCDENTPHRIVSQLIEEDPELRDVVEEFVDGLADRLAELKVAFEQMDYDLLATLAHRLKGAGGSYGYPELSDVCAKMEQEFRAHDSGNFDDWLKKLSQLQAGAVEGLRS